MRIALILISVFSLLACSQFNAGEMFSANVIQTTAGEVTNVRAGQISCLHCPMFFSFEATAVLVKRVVDTHQLRKVNSLPSAAKQIEELVLGEVTWWQSADTKTNDQINWAHYSSKSSGQDPAFRLFVIKNGKAFFITSGHFSNEQYVRDNA